MEANFLKFAFRIFVFAVGIHSLLADDEKGVVHTSPKEALPLDGSTSDDGSETSTLSVPIRVSLTDLNNRLNALVPNSFHCDGPISVPGANGGSHASFDVSRNAIVLSPSGNGGIVFSANVGVNGYAHYNFWTVHNHTGFNGAATVSGQVNPTIAEDWQIQPNPQVHVDVHQATVHIFNTSVRGLATRMINAAIPGLAAKGAADLNSALGIREKLSSYWSAAFRTVQLSDGPDTFVQFAPRALRLVQPHVTGDGFLESGAAIDCGLSMIVGDRPGDQTPSPLPPPTLVSSVDNAFQVYVPVSISLTDVARELEKRLSEGNIQFGEDAELKVTGITVGSTGNTLLIRVAIEATNTAANSHLEGELTLQGVPVATDNGNKIGFDQIDYTVDSRSELVEIASWLVRPVILEKLGSELRLDLKDQISVANDYVNQELSSRLSSNNLDPSIDIDSLQAKRVLLAGDQLIVCFLVKGTCELNLNL